MALLGFLGLPAGQADGLLGLELRQQAQRGGVAGQGKAPHAQAGGFVVQFQLGGARVVGQAER
ncbi:hypothetical protein D9M68_778290 [compost metagenome]